MMARIIAADDHKQGVVETTDNGCYVVTHSGHDELIVGDYLSGWSNQPQDIEVEVRPLGKSRDDSFKLTKLNWFPDAEQALNVLRSNSSATTVCVRVPPYLS